MNSPASRLSGGSRQAAKPTKIQRRKPGVSHCLRHQRRRCCCTRVARNGRSRNALHWLLDVSFREYVRAIARISHAARSPSCCVARSISSDGTRRRVPSPSTSSAQPGTTHSYEAFTTGWQRHDLTAIALLPAAPNIPDRLAGGEGLVFVTLCHKNYL